MRTLPWRRRAAVAICSALTLAGCASTPDAASPVSGASRSERSGEPFGLVGPETPLVLKNVRQAPYAAPDPLTCPELDHQISELDSLLGPDVDALGKGRDNQVGEWVSGQIRGLIPYRGVVRFMTGAGRKEKEMAAALLAGAARRGFLKGVRRTLPCPAMTETDVAEASTGD